MTIDGTINDLIFSNSVGPTLDDIVEGLGCEDMIIITDDIVADLVLSQLKAESKALSNAKEIIVRSGDINKNLEQLASIWQKLIEYNATRSTLVVNVGGGMVTDLGGFAAATFKRGLTCVNIPTTLLGAVDAAVGGKTAINFGGIKNLVGVFSEPICTIVSTVYFKTLTQEQIYSGYAEMLKHALIDSRQSYNELSACNPSALTSDKLLELLQRSVMIKERIVRIDPTEKGLRKTLNFGHTVGHAFEAFSMQRNANAEAIPHGYAVAQGMVVEMILSHISGLGLGSNDLRIFADYVFEHYGAFAITCKDYPRLIELMRQDKKNINASEINFTLLADIGDARINCKADAEEIGVAFDIYRDLMHLA